MRIRLTGAAFMVGLTLAPAPIAAQAPRDALPATRDVALLVQQPRIALPPASAAAVSPLRTAILNELAYREGITREEGLKAWLAGLKTFYMDVDYEPIWVRDGRLTPAAGELMEELGRAERWGLRPVDYDVPTAYRALTSGKDQALAEIDLTLAALRYTFHAHGGRFDPSSLSLWYDAKPNRPDSGNLLRRFASASDAGDVLRAQHPAHPQFVALREAYLDIIDPQRRVSEKPAEPAPEDIVLPRGPAVRLGNRSSQVPLLRKRLSVPPRRSQDADLYDKQVRDAVNAFMRTQGWKRKHVYDNKVRTRLNRQANGGNKRRAIDKKTLLVNLEKWRLMPRELGAFHVWNNLPSYRTEVRRNGDVIHTERIIVGKTSTQTPVFNDRMTHVVFKPEWGVPTSIKIKSLLPKLAGGDYDVLRRRNMRIPLRGRQGNPRRINWARRDISKIPIIQGPGPSNPLGNMKFMFPNRHAVYMHDTPKKHLFKTRNRTHSAGCIRVRYPRQFAEVILRESLGWDKKDISRQLGRRARSNQRVDLNEAVPVYNTYFTVVANEDGKLRRYKDMYGHDKRISKALDGVSPRVIAR
ncbi:MAG: L,D-transpeptidase family protein, partial [Pseudomonadota bacterium]